MSGPSNMIRLMSDKINCFQARFSTSCRLTMIATYSMICFNSSIPAVLNCSIAPRATHLSSQNLVGILIYGYSHDVLCHLSQNANDTQDVKEELKSMGNSTGQLPEKMSLDKGYQSGSNLEALEQGKAEANLAPAANTWR